MKVIIFSSEYIPYNNTGTYRTKKFVEGLEAANVEVEVVTLTKEGADHFVGNDKVDSSLANEQMETHIHRVIPKDLFQKYFSISGLAVKHFRNHKEFYSYLTVLLNKFKPDAIYATHPHSATIRIAADVAERFQLPFYVDMRDTWSHWAFSPFKTWFHYYHIRRAEQRVFSLAKQIITVSDGVSEIFTATHGNHLKGKISIIHNSTENGNIERTEYQSSSLQSKEIITIGYVGSFYYSPEVREEMFTKWFRRKGARKFSWYSAKEDWLYRSPYFFLKTIRQLLDKHPELKSRVNIEFVGNKTAWLPAMIKKQGLEEQCRIIGFLKKNELLERYQQYDFLLTTSEKVFNGNHYCIPSKLFDYIKMGKPILGFLTPGVQQDFLRNSGAGFVFDPDNTEHAAVELLQLLEQQRTLKLDLGYLEKFSLPYVSKQLIDVLAGKTVAQLV